MNRNISICGFSPIWSFPTRVWATYLLQILEAKYKFQLELIYMRQNILLKTVLRNLPLQQVQNLII